MLITSSYWDLEDIFPDYQLHILANDSINLSTSSSSYVCVWHIYQYEVNMAKNKAEYRPCSGEDDFTHKH